MSARLAVIRPLCSGTEWEFQEPLGAEAICGCMRARGHDCRVFDRQLDRRAGQDTVAEIMGWRPDAVGFSLMSAGEAGDALRLLQELKYGLAANKKDLRFCAGGLYVTTAEARARAEFPAYVELFRGEGEGAVAAWLEETEAERAMSPEEWAFPSRDRAEEYLRFGGVLNIRGSRGCAGACKFCATPLLPFGQCRWAGRSVELLAREIAELAKRYPPIFNFVDDDFGPLSRIKALEDELCALGMRAVFSLELRAGHLLGAGVEELEKLHDGGLCRVFVGLESVNEVTLRAWGKPQPPKAVLAAVERCRAAGIEMAVGYILWHGAQTPEGARCEMETLRRYGLLDPRSALSRLAVFPGSRLHEERASSGRAYLEPLLPETEKAYRSAESLLRPLAPIWSRVNTALPGEVCRERLEMDNHAAKLRALRDRLAELAASLIMDGAELPSGKLLRLEEETDAVCAAGSGEG